MSQLMSVQKIVARTLLSLLVLAGAPIVLGDDDKVAQGSRTARNGFRNEDDVQRKFEQWATDPDAQAWLKVMGYDPKQIRHVATSKPHGSKADVELVVTTPAGTRVEGVSIKLVSSRNGFNQIDKRWLKSYAEIWSMPKDVIAGMQLYLGELPPVGKSRRENRMYLDELPAGQRTAIMNFFTANKQKIVKDLVAGRDQHVAEWFLVSQKVEQEARWVIVSAEETIRFFSEGPVTMTRAGNLKLGRISMQRKGGDNGRKTASMLQFKLNPALLFDLNQ